MATSSPKPPPTDEHRAHLLFMAKVWLLATIVLVVVGIEFRHLLPLALCLFTISWAVDNVGDALRPPPARPRCVRHQECREQAEDWGQNDA